MLLPPASFSNSKRKEANLSGTSLKASCSLLMFSLLIGGMAAGVHAEDQVFGNHDLSFQEETVDSVTAGHQVSLNKTTVEHGVTAGYRVSGEGCQVHGGISAGHEVTLSGCTVDGPLTVGQAITLDHTTVHGDVTVGREARLSDATIEGTLTIAAPLLQVRHSLIENIRIEPPSGAVSTKGTQFRGSLTIHNGQISTSSNGHTLISVGPNSTSSINGYMIRSTQEATTLMAPDDTVYKNGKRIAGDGPATYRGYQEAHSQAPVIKGPGWHDDGAVANSHSKSLLAKEPTSVVELMEQSEVTGNITFVDGRGKVILHAGSTIHEDPTGGSVDRRNN